MMRCFNSVMFLLMAGLPFICANHPISLTLSEMQFASVNDSATLWCNLTYKHHLPDNVKIEWFDGPLPVKSALNGITIKDTKTKTNQLESKMIINKVENFHFGRYSCKTTGTRHPLEATTFLLPRGVNDGGKNLITNINLTHAGLVPLTCNNISPGSNNVSWKKVQFNQTVVSLDIKSTSFNDTVTSLSDTGKFVCYDDNTVFQISYVYPQDYHSLRFTEDLANNVTLTFNDTNSLLLTCTVPKSSKHTELYWILNNETLKSDVVKRVHVPSVLDKGSEYQLQLIITTPIPETDTGTYTCVAENEWEKIERHFNIKFDIKNVDPFTITSFTSQEYMVDGAEFTATCVIKLNKGIKPNVFMLYSNDLSNSYPTLVMEDANTSVRLTADVAKQVVTATLTIKSASEKNNGTYYCFVLNFNDPMMQTLTTQYIKRPVEIINYYEDPTEQHSITCQAHVLVTVFMNSTTIKFTHQTDHGHNAMYDPTSITMNTTDKSITAHLDLSRVHAHHRYHGIYVCTTSASLQDKPDKIYSDSRDLTVEHKTKKHTVSGLEFSVQSSTDQNSNTPTTETVYIVAGVMVFVVATTVLVFVVLHQRLRRSKHSILNQPQHV